jgi:hypothetical protein
MHANGTASINLHHLARGARFIAVWLAPWWIANEGLYVLANRSRSYAWTIAERPSVPPVSLPVTVPWEPVADGAFAVPPTDSQAAVCIPTSAIGAPSRQRITATNAGTFDVNVGILTDGGPVGAPAIFDASATVPGGGRSVHINSPDTSPNPTLVRVYASHVAALGHRGGPLALTVDRAEQ